MSGTSIIYGTVIWLYRWKWRGRIAELVCIPAIIWRMQSLICNSSDRFILGRMAECSRALSQQSSDGEGRGFEPEFVHVFSAYDCSDSGLTHCSRWFPPPLENQLAKISVSSDVHQWPENVLYDWCKINARFFHISELCIVELSIVIYFHASAS